MTKPVTLADKYEVASGRIYISGIQALVRLPTIQQQRDALAGRNTGGFISGYRGSPLGGLDNELWRQQALLERHNVVFQSGLNEDLAATAVWGSQQVNLQPDATVDGVFGLWYGKGPGVDRTMDVLKHANMAGTSPWGGVLAIAGDDHGCQSSTLPHQSEQLFEAALLPILNPANVQEYLDFGLYGWALSRFSGCWVGFKAIAETVESATSIDVDITRPQIVLPTDFEAPPGGVHIRWPDPPLEAERRLHGPKMDAVAAFVRANAIDKLVVEPPAPRLGIITTGKAYLDVRQAFDDLGLDVAAIAALGIRIYKVGLTWPLERQGALRFAAGLQDVLVVEEKRGFIERQLVEMLYNMEASRRPSVVGKRDESGGRLLGSEGEITPTMVARAIVSRLERFDAVTPNLRQRVARLESFERVTSGTKLARTPFFCSGCPHNTSTAVPEGSRAMAGIGCHGMATYMPHRRTQTITQMGGEGTNWIGQAPFTATKHVFQNLGDGTYTHSGSIALRAAAAAGVNITYKILYNDAVAMTGGQPAEGSLTVPQIAHQVAAEGAKVVAVVSDEPNKYPSAAVFPPGTLIHHRDDLDALQRRLRDTPGLTAIIYDQTCAAEKRRRRKRGQFPDPPKRVFINEAVCEGCGDCSTQSNCISVKPLDTELGRKRQIDQSACNKDFSCLKGFCPSFVTVHGGRIRKAERATVAAGEDPFAALPPPRLPQLSEPYSILITGIGGTGVLTVGALLGMAAHLDRKGASVLDFTGLAQKNGAVMSHVRLAATPDDLKAVRIGAGGADLLLGCDLVVTAGAEALARIERDVTRAVVNTHEQPTAAFVTDASIDFEGHVMRKAVTEAVGAAGLDLVDATRIATRLMGDSIAANLFILGYAFQKGLVPLSLEAIDGAIALNNVSVEANRQTFAWGRLAAHDAAAVNRFVDAGKASARPPREVPRDLAALVADRAGRLAHYQDEAYARRYQALVETARAAEEHIHGDGRFTDAVARHFYKLMAYKDEYEVARLYVDPVFQDKLSQQFDGDYRIEFNLAPPLLARRDPETGIPKKRAFGPWILPAFRLLARLRRLRGTPLDIFGYTEERRTERRLIDAYEATIREVSAALRTHNLPLAAQIAAIPDAIRGFGHVKAAQIAIAGTREAELLDAFRAASGPAAGAAVAA
ncbi:indolepyruvate ferredoxin oxidoreductase family protein [Chelatococcus reniformis]|uniref:Indolepyruvate ferredoxin oxidoreductase n=1 Tax=Chelatococcus reniformis TaxID=1494448 RepID=A0A916U9N3_9HYPH|nr:indolepyruvate ferredoxin oxidoreductase family protein [Chelatococcus reniformis]GGC65663.1 indolepyruvate ferredoxin oxidoreductase [Chelatococcus reniformis]